MTTVGLEAREMATPSSTVWKYFQLTEKRTKVRCELCKRCLKFNSSTSCMWKHMKAFHRTELTSLEQPSASASQDEVAEVSNVNYRKFTEIV